MLSASSDYNTKTPSGKLNQRVELALASYDNESKAQLTRDLGRARLLEGRWIGKAPRGYDQKTTKAHQIITINEEGKFIKKAFLWKANEKLTNEEIRQRLEKLGLNISKQKLSEIFKNPFYCGLLVHNFLNGEVMKGNHPALVSEETFLKANEVLNTNYTGGYTQKLEKDWAPLLGTLKCPCCGYNVTAYISTKMRKKHNKELYYYYCSRKGCKFNNRVIAVHEAFNKQLSNTSIKDLDKKVFELQLTKVFNALTKEDKSDVQKMQTEATKLSNQLKQMEANWAIELNPKKQDILWNQIEEIEKKRNAIIKDLSNKENSILNLNDFLKYAVDLSCNPLKMWEVLDLGDKQSFQNLIFPEGVLFDKKNSHIEPITVNNFFIVNSNISMTYEDKKKELLDQKIKKSRYVPEAGLEPAQP